MAAFAGHAEHGAPRQTAAELQVPHAVADNMIVVVQLQLQLQLQL